MGINYKDERTKALDFLTKFKNPFDQVIFDPDGDLAIELGVYGAPETYFLDRDGVIRHRHVGILSQENWQGNLVTIWQGMQQ